LNVSSVHSIGGSLVNGPPQRKPRLRHDKRPMLGDRTNSLLTPKLFLMLKSELRLSFRRRTKPKCEHKPKLKLNPKPKVMVIKPNLELKPSFDDHCPPPNWSPHSHSTPKSRRTLERPCVRLTRPLAVHRSSRPRHMQRGGDRYRCTARS
jgi:hypothetical protein